MFVRLESTLSTNDEAKRLAAEGAPHGTAVVADRQTGGRGRLGRTWQSPPGNLYLSVILRMRPEPLVSLAAAVAVASCDARLTLKWPNDLQIGGRKVAGILCESDGDAIVVGVGVNLVWAPPDLPATVLSGHERLELAEAIRVALVDEVARLRVDPAAVLARWRARATTLGQRVRVGDVEGLAVDVDTDGALLVDTGAAIVRVLSGDVVAR